MASAVYHLNHKQAMTRGPGRHPDGDGLYLDVKASRDPAAPPLRSWTLIFSFNNRRREMSLGSPPATSLKEARELRDTFKKMAREGVNPIAERQAQRLTNDRRLVAPAKPDVLSFGQFADDRYQKLLPRWRSPVTQQSWKNTLETWCAPIRALPLADIGQKHVLMVVELKWEQTPDMAAQVQERLRSLLDTAIALGEHPGPNPATWEGKLEHILAPKQRLSRGPHAAIDFEQAPAFYSYLQKRRGMGARALQFVMLTGVRSDQAVSARWSEFDLKAKLWKVPIARCQKIRRFLKENNYDHFLIPLAAETIELLKELAVQQFGAGAFKPDSFVFFGAKPGCQISNGTMERCIDEYGGPHATVHGMRSAFRDWAGDKMIIVDGVQRRAYTEEGVEIFIGHIVGDSARRAYRRRQAMPERTVIAQEWAQYLLSATRRLTSATAA